MSADSFLTQVADTLQTAADDTFCLTPNDAVSAAVKAAVRGVCRLPPILSLSQLLAVAAKVPYAPLERIVDAARLAPPLTLPDEILHWRIYECLRDHCGDRPAARFQLAGKLAKLFNELDDYRLPVPALDNPFSALAVGGEPLSYQAQVAAAVWDALATDAALCPKRRLLLQLVEKIKQPPIAVVTDETTPLAAEFFRRINATILSPPPVAAEVEWARVLSVDSSGAVTPEAQLAAAWEGAAGSLTATANLALVAARRLLAESPLSATVGIVVYDRLLARRLRAVAEAEQVFIRDRIGWRAETLSYGAALRTYLAAVLGEFNPAAVGELLQPPFSAAPAADRAWRKLLADSLNLPTSWEDWEKTALPLAAFAAAICRRRRRAPQRASPLQWLDWLQTTAAAALSTWRRDTVALNLMAQARVVAADLASAAVQLDSNEFCLWFDRYLETAQPSEDSIDSPLEFVPPTTRRQFSSLLLLGYIDRPAVWEDGWLGENERRALALPAKEADFDRQRRHFCRLMAAHKRVAAVWRKVGDDGENLSPHPFWRLTAADCHRRGCLQRLEWTPVLDPTPGLTPPPPARAQILQWPQSLSLTAADELMVCPYRFYITHILRLDDGDADNELMPSARLNGKILHRVMQSFSCQTETVGDEQALAAGWRRAVLQETVGNRPALALTATYWLARADEFIRWEWRRRQDGWRTIHTERSVSASWTAATQTVRWSGRIDRVDEDSDGQYAIIDYKSGVPPTKNDLQTGEAPQLSMYAFFWWLAEGKSVTEKMICSPVGAFGKVCDDRVHFRTAARLRTVLRQIDVGHALPANGVPDKCATCFAAGICRRAHWLEDDK